MKTKLMLSMLVLGAFNVFAAPPPGGKPGKWGAEREERREQRLEEREREARLMYVVTISEALELSEADAIKLSERIKGVEEKRRPLRQAMGEAMRSLRDAADGDPAALPQVDANVQKVLDGRAQMAVMDKELFNTLAQGYAPQKRAKLALVLGRLHQEMKGLKRDRRDGER